MQMQLQLQLQMQRPQRQRLHHLRADVSPSGGEGVRGEGQMIRAGPECRLANF